MMHRFSQISFILAACFLKQLWADANVVRHPLNMGLQYEFGAVERGTYQEPVDGQVSQLQNEWVDHIGAYFIQSITINDRVKMLAGIGGSFQFRKPQVNGVAFEASSRGAPFLGPIGMASYAFGDVENPYLEISAGSIAYKYNSNSKVLGEYLFRSSPYPTLLRTGGYQIVNNSKAYLRGLKASYKHEGFSADLLLTTETSLPPLFDFSLGAVAKYSLFGGVLELGAGFLSKSLIPVDPDRTQPKHDDYAYFNYNGKYYLTSASYYRTYRIYYDDRLFAAAEEIEGSLPGFDVDTVGATLSQELTLALTQNGVDPNRFASDLAQRNKWDSELTTVLDVKDSLIANNMVEYYTFAGTSIMGMASLDIQKWLPISFLGEQDLKMYFEVNLLGIENYPVLFENRMDRVPLVFGINLPTFKILDLLSFEYEIWNNPHLNNSYNIGKTNRVAPYLPTEGPLDGSDALTKNDFNDATQRDNIKWAIMAEKKIGNNIHIRAQAGRTHLQLTGTAFFFGPQYLTQEVTTLPDDWYWMCQLEWGI